MILKNKMNIAIIPARKNSRRIKIKISKFLMVNQLFIGQLKQR
jgi:CMP-N-acetylneuraminic acid synthetase